MERIEKDPLGLDRECDWVIKYRLVEAYRARHQLALGAPAGGAFGPAVPRRRPQPRDLLPSAGQGAGRSHRHRRSHRQGDGLSRRRRPGRALRGEFIRRAKEKRRDFTVDWVHLKLNDQTQRTVLLKDPFRSHDERVERLIESI